jgi:hypothetical protein
VPAASRSVSGDGGADDVDPVEPGLLFDLRLLPLNGEAGVGDGDVEVLGHLVLVQDLAGLLADLGGAGEPAGRSAGGDRGEQLLGGRQEGLALAGALAGQGRVAAGDQPLAGEVLAGDLGEVLLVEEAELERAVVGGELADGRGAQRGDPGVPAVEFPDGLDAGGGDHAAVADQDHLPEPEPVVHGAEDLGERSGVGGVPVEDPDRDGPAGGVGEQPVLDLHVAFLAVAGVAAGPQRAVRPLQPGTRQVRPHRPHIEPLRGQADAGKADRSTFFLTLSITQRGAICQRRLLRADSSWCGTTGLEVAAGEVAGDTADGRPGRR